MFSQRFYYHLKPYVPWAVRMAVRRLSARHKRARVLDLWPIDPSAGRQPAGWPGWPEGKRFAFVLTHDVEGSAGLQKCRRLALLEEQLGFRSCFNFIPAGAYSVPPALRSWLIERGFEVGVHDLEHDGKLFQSRREFETKATRINRFLQEWGAAGFRAGFMLRNLDWLHDLHIQYDSSTFDTDPFELQSEGVGTIFPFWHPRPPPAGATDAPVNGHAMGASRDDGYLELPYTMPQDSTLFLVLQESSIEVWTRKLDWIAEHGGMALVNVHPDYLRFEERRSGRTYPLSHYQDLLDYVRSRYAGAYWQPTPGALAGFVAGLPQRPTLQRPRRVCMITHSFYESDNRVTRYAEALAARGDQVDVLALRRSPNLPRSEVVEGVSVFRIQNRFGKTERSQFEFLWPLLRFLVRSSWWLTRRHAHRRYDLLHIHNMPDFLVFAGWYPRLTGTPIVLDIHDIVPEFYSSKFGSGRSTPTTSVLRFIERHAARFADHVIISNHLWLQKYEARTQSQGKCSVFINNVDTRVFQPQPRTRTDGKILVLFPGGLQWHQGLDIALRAFSRVLAALPAAEFHIYGDGNMKPALIALAEELKFDGRVKFFEPVRVKDVARIMANADLGVVPKRADSFGNEAYSTKIMEFMSLGVPVVVSKTRIDQFYFNDSVVRFFPSGDSDALAEAMIDVLSNPALRQRIVANALVYSREQSWDRRRADYLAIVDRLIAAAPISTTTGRPDPVPFESRSVPAVSEAVAARTPAELTDQPTAARRVANVTVEP